MEKQNNIFVKEYTDANYEWLLSLAAKQALHVSRIAKNPDLYNETTVEYKSLSELPEKLDETIYGIWLKYDDSSIFFDFNCNYIGMDHFFEPAQFDITNEKTKEIVQAFSFECVFISLGFEISFFLNRFEGSVRDIKSRIPLYTSENSLLKKKKLKRSPMPYDIDEREQSLINYIQNFIEWEIG